MRTGTSTGVGSISKPGNTGLPVLSSAPAHYEAFRAGGAIPVGSTVIMDKTANSGGLSVVVAPLSEPWGIVGVYTGRGGTGAATTAVAGAGDGGALPSRGDNKAAVAGDLIEVCVWGTCQALVKEAALTVEGVGLTASAATTGVLILATEPTTGENVKAVSLSDAATGSGEDFYTVFLT